MILIPSFSMINCLDLDLNIVLEDKTLFSDCLQAIN